MGGVEAEWRRCSVVSFFFAFPQKEKLQRMKFCSKFASTRVHLGTKMKKENPKKQINNIGTIAAIDIKITFSISI